LQLVTSVPKHRAGRSGDVIPRAAAAFAAAPTAATFLNPTAPTAAALFRGEET
jgi:hypothetical protein